MESTRLAAAGDAAAEGCCEVSPEPGKEISPINRDGSNGSGLVDE
jgi:hypothetical protein